MLAHVRWSVAVALLAGGPLLSADEGPIKKAMKDVEGTWRAVRLEKDGNKLSEKDLKVLELTLILKGNRWAFRSRGMVRAEGTYKIVALEKGVRQVDLAVLEFEGGKVITRLKEIVKLEGDTLTVCQAPDGKPRPKAFAAGAGTGQMLWVYKREKR